jgi:hypothetical protein
MKQRLRHILILVPTILLIVLAYSPGLHGPYVLDDGENITQNRAVAIHDLGFNSIRQALTSNESGPLKRPLAALSFAINHYAAGGFDNSFPFKLVNLLIHLINAGLLYGLTLLLLRTSAIAASVPSRLQPYLAGATTLIWALHPLQLTTVLYVVQRMNSLSAMFVLLGLLAFCHGRHLLASFPRYGLAMMYTGVVLGTLLGLGTKENAALLPLFALTIEYTLFRRDSLVPATQRQLRWFYSLCVVMPVIFFVSYLLAYPEFVTDAYAERRFTPLERLMTQPRVLWFYLSLILLPSTHRLGLFHDDLAVSTSLVSPLTTLPAITALMTIFILAVWKARKYPIASFAVLWFLAGHLLESSIFGLEIAYEHRNYMPNFGIIFGIVMATATLFQRMRLRETSWIASSITVVVVLAFSTFSRATTWGDIHLLAEHTASHHPESPRSNDFAARVELAYARNPVRAINYVIQGLHAEPSEAGFHIDLQILLETLAHDVNATLITHRQINAAQRDGLIVTGLPDTVHVTASPSGVKMVYSASNSDTILQLLRNQPITVHTIVSIENLRKCIVENPRPCQKLAAEARDWLAVASENPLTSPDYRAMIHSNLAQLYADMNDIARAYENISHASRIAPEEESYHLGKIDYLIRLGQLAEAGKLLAPYIETDTKKAFARTANQDTVQRLKERYRLAVEKRGTSPRSQ